MEGLLDALPISYNGWEETYLFGEGGRRIWAQPFAFSFLEPTGSPVIKVQRA